MSRTLFAVVFTLLIAPQLKAATSDAFFQDLEQIRAKSPSLQAELERARARNAAALSGSLFWTPTLSVSAGRSATETNGAVTSDADYWKGTAALNLFKGGGDFHAKNAAQFAAQAQEEQIRSESLKLEVRSSELVFRRLYLLDAIKYAREQVKLREESHRVVLARFKQGRIPQQEVTRSEIDKVQQETQARSFETELLENRALIGALLIGELKTMSWPFSTEQRMGRARREKNPESERLSLLAKAAESTWKAGRAAHWPSLDLSVSYGEAPLRDRATRQWITGLTLTFPLWSQYETSAKAANAFADFVAARGEAAVQEASEQAQRAILEKRVESARQNLRDARQNLERARKLYGDVFKSFQLGRMSVNDLLLEQERLIKSQSGLSQSELAFHKVLLESCALLGEPAVTCLSK